MPETLDVLPSTTAGTVITGFTDVVADNIGVLLAVLGFAWGLYFVTSRLNRVKKGKI